MTKPDKTIVYNTCEILDAKNGLDFSGINISNECCGRYDLRL